VSYAGLFDQILEDLTLGRFTQGMALLANTLDTAAAGAEALAIATAVLRQHPLDEMLREDPLYVGSQGGSSALYDRLALAASDEAPATCSRTGQELFRASHSLRLRQALCRRQAALSARLERSWQSGQRICLLGGEALLHTPGLTGRDLGNVTVLSPCPATARALNQTFHASLDIVPCETGDLLSLARLPAGKFDLAVLGNWTANIADSQLANLLDRLEPQLTENGAIIFGSLVRGHSGSGFARAYIGWQPQPHDLERLAKTATNLHIHSFELTPGCMAWAECAHRDQQGETMTVTMIETSLKAIARGDTDAFNGLYRTWQPRLVAYAAGLLAGDRSSALDIVDEALMTVWQQAGRFSGSGSGEGWLRRIVRNKAIDWLRREGRAHALDTAHGQLRELADPKPDPEAASATKSEASALRQLLSQLPLDQREAVWLCYFEERSMAEIAEICGCPTNTVKTRLFHARRKLRNQFQFVNSQR
jgi:RNA polymerase sigma-70 factor, ECF subfamily